MCTQKPPNDYSQELYDGYRSAFDKYLNDKVVPALMQKSGESMLRELVRRWRNQQLMVRWLSRFFNYLDRYYVDRHGHWRLYDVGMWCFKHKVYLEVRKSAKDSILDLINREREGEQIDRDLIKSTLEIFVQMQTKTDLTYTRDFEAFLIKDTASYYSRRAAEWAQGDSCPEYMMKAEAAIECEKERCDRYLQTSTEPELLSAVDNELLTKKQSEIIDRENSGCNALLIADKSNDLARMYRLFARISNVQPIADTFKHHVKAKAEALVAKAEESAGALKKETRGRGEQPEAKEANGDRAPEGNEKGSSNGDEAQASNKAKSGGGATKSKEKEQAGSQMGAEHMYIRNMLSLHDKYLTDVAECFGNSPVFHTALKEAFEGVLNKDVAGSSTAEHLSAFCDNLLRKGGPEKLADEEVEGLLGRAVKLLAYIDDKDKFAEFYRKKLGRRLLFQRSANEEHERVLLTKLKQECGASFTQKMEGMLKDLSLAKNLQTSFEEAVSNASSSSSAKPPIDLNVTVLTMGNWPSYPSADVHLPRELKRSVDIFNDFYASRSSSRKLNWIFSLGQVHLSAKFDSKKMELMASTYQALTLLLFNEHDALSVSDISERLNLPLDDTKRTVHSLSYAKYRILLKEPDSKTIDEKDALKLNTQFTDKMRRIKLPLPPVDDRKKVEETVDKDRSNAVDAAIVRTLKSRKVLGHQQLVFEVAQQLNRSFKPDVKLIKKRIEALITLEFLERDSDSPDTYRYLA